jgi:hypothetical protein
MEVSFSFLSINLLKIKNMKSLFSRNKSENDLITVFRHRRKDMEEMLYKAHDGIMKDTVIPYAKDLAERNKPELESKSEQAYCGILSGAYGKLMMLPKTELQTDIETLHIVSDKEEAQRQLNVLHPELEAKQNKLRLKRREFEEKDSAHLKKHQRYQRKRFWLIFMILIDMLLSSSALQALGYPLLTSYIIGLGIGVGIFFIAEYLPNIIRKGRTRLQRRAIAITSFLGLATIFYVLGIFRSVSLDGTGYVGRDAWPFYFMCLNLFFVVVATAVSYFAKLSREERALLDQWQIAKNTAETLQQEVAELEDRITAITKEEKRSELARKQLLIYAQDIQQLIQQLFEEAFKTFMATNLNHRSDGKMPLFFEHDIPKLPVFFKDFKL